MIDGKRQPMFELRVLHGKNHAELIE